MEEDGLSADDLFSQCVFRQDERDMVLKAVHLVQPDYKPRLHASAAQCPSLVQEFYTQVPLEAVDTEFRCSCVSLSEPVPLLKVANLQDQTGRPGPPVMKGM